MSRRSTLAGAILLALAACAAAGPPLPPAPTRYVTDLAHVLDPARADALNERLAAFERETSDQVLVYVDRTLPEGTTIDAWCQAAMNAWGTGQAGKDNGLGLFVFIDDRSMRIHVGYGLERAVSNETAARIIQDVLRPAFKKGDYTAGIEAGVDEMLKAARSAGYRGDGRSAAEKKAASP